MPAMHALLHHLGAHDAALFHRWVMPPAAPLLRLRCWRALTHLGGAPVTIGVTLLLVMLAPDEMPGRWHGLLTLAISHLVVQVLKRQVQRDRPAGTPLTRCPDRFSFPSGHATASLALALTLGTALPTLAIPLFLLGMVVGWSRVVLGVHYPGDVFIGQLLAIATATAVRALG